MSTPNDLCRGQRISMSGEPLDRAHAAMVMVHGRGATAESILLLADEFDAVGFAYVAPQAADNTWYPYRFIEPLAHNEPWLTFSLGALGSALQLVADAGIPPERTILLGFSQGACLALEFAARNARRYGGIVGLSGGLIGPDDTPRNYPGSFDGTPVFLGCSDVDYHVPKERVIETGEVFERMGARVTVRLYPNMDHTVNEDEINAVREIMASLTRF